MPRRQNPSWDAKLEREQQRTTAKLHGEAATLRHRVSELEAEIVKLQQQLKQQQQQQPSTYKASLLQAEIHRLKSIIDEHEATIARLMSERGVLQRENDKLRAENDKLRAEKKNWAEGTSALAQKCKAYKRSIADLSWQECCLKGVIRRMASELETLRWKLQHP